MPTPSIPSPRSREKTLLEFTKVRTAHPYRATPPSLLWIPSSSNSLSSFCFLSSLCHPFSLWTQKKLQTFHNRTIKFHYQNPLLLKINTFLHNHLGFGSCSWCFWNWSWTFLSLSVKGKASILAPTQHLISKSEPILLKTSTFFLLCIPIWALVRVTDSSGTEAELFHFFLLLGFIGI